MLVAPTGSGKTVIGSAIIKSIIERRRGVLVLAHRREIITQTSDKLHANEIPHGIIMAGVRVAPAGIRAGCVNPNTVGARRAAREHGAAAGRSVGDRRSAPLPGKDLSQDHRRLSRRDPARPDRHAMPRRRPRARRHLRDDHRMPAGRRADRARLSGQDARLCAGRSRPQGRARAGRRLRRKPTRRAHGPARSWSATSSPTGTSTASAGRPSALRSTSRTRVHLRDEFIKSGVRAEHIDGGTPKPERDASLARLASGEIELVSNCMVLTEGWDMPEVGCCILARPTKKMGLYRQMIGRVLRPAEGKPDAIILDHSGAVFRHGFAEDPVEWTLDPDTRAESPEHAARVRRRIEIALARMLAMRRHPHRRRTVLRLRVPANAAAAAVHRSATVSSALSKARRAKRRRVRSRGTREWLAHAAPPSRRARLQARLGRRQLQGKIRRLAALGRCTSNRSRQRPKSDRGCARA